MTDRDNGYLIRQNHVTYDPIQSAENRGNSEMRLALFRSELKTSVQEYFDFYHFMMSIACDNPKEYNVKKVFDPKRPFTRNKYIASWSDGDTSQEVSYHTEKTPVGERLLLDGASVIYHDIFQMEHDPARVDIVFDANLTVASVRLSLHSQHLEKRRQKSTAQEEEINGFLDRYVYGGISSYDLIDVIEESRRDHRRRVYREIQVNFNENPFFRTDITTRVLDRDHFAFTFYQLPQENCFEKAFATENDRREYVKKSANFLVPAVEEIIPHEAVTRFVHNLFSTIPTKRFSK